MVRCWLWTAIGAALVASGGCGARAIPGEGDVPVPDSAWQVVAQSTSALNAIWGAGSDDVWVVGDRGQVLRFDGRSWGAVASDASAQTFIDVSGCRGAVWIASADEARRFDNGRWQTLRGLREASAIACTAGGHAAVVDRAAVATLGPGRIESVFSGDHHSDGELVDVAARADGMIVVSTERGVLVRAAGSSTWRREGSPLKARHYDRSWIGVEAGGAGRVWLSSEHGLAEGTCDARRCSWQRLRPRDIDGYAMRAVIPTARGGFLAGGKRILRLHDGRWSEIALPDDLARAQQSLRIADAWVAHDESTAYVIARLVSPLESDASVPARCQGSCPSFVLKLALDQR